MVTSLNNKGITSPVTHQNISGNLVVKIIHFLSNKHKLFFSKYYMYFFI